MSIKVGIIGLGVGEAHIKGYESHPECEVVSICDFNPDVARKMSVKYPNKKVYTDPNKILEDPEIDAVSIASFDNYHYDQICKAIAADKHLFIEKPLCLYKEEAAEIRSLLDAKPEIRMSSNLILRQSERFIELKKMLDRQALGEVYYISGAYNYGRIHKIVEGWRGKLPFYSVVYGGGVHLLDLYLWFMGERITEVSAMGNNISTKGSNFSNVDMNVSLLQFESGATGHLSCNFACVHPHFHQLEVYGTTGTFINGLEEATLYDNREDLSPKAIKTAYPGTHKGDLLPDFINAIIEKREPLVSKKDIFDTMSVCYAIEEATQSRKPVKVDYL